MSKHDYSYDLGKTWINYGSLKHYLITLRSIITRPFTNKYQMKYLQIRVHFPIPSKKINIKMRDSK